MFVTIWLCRVGNSIIQIVLGPMLYTYSSGEIIGAPLLRQNKIAVLILDDIVLYSHKTVRIPEVFNHLFIRVRIRIPAEFRTQDWN